MKLRYKYRIYPSVSQQHQIMLTFSCARVAFNDVVAARRSAFENGLPFPSRSEHSRALTQAKQTHERAWLANVSATVLQQALADAVEAYQRFSDSLSGKRRGRKFNPPNFRSRKDSRQTARFTGDAFRVLPQGYLRLGRIGDVKVRWSRPLPSSPSSVTIIKDASGRYFASFVVEVAEVKLPELVSEIGIDLGLSSFAAFSNELVVNNPKFLQTSKLKLKQMHQSLDRKQKGSNNRNKARIKLARQYAKVAASRKDFHHRLSTQIIRENQAVYVEDLNVAGLIRNRRLSKNISDAGWSQFVNMLNYKAKLYGRDFHKIDRFQPSSQICSVCEVKDGPKPLHIRSWTCACGTEHDRDLNAAKNILALGRRRG